MKKVMLILMLGVFTLSSSSFDANVTLEVDCNEVAAAAWQNARNQGASYEQAYAIYVGTHQACESSKKFEPTINQFQ